MENNYSRQKTGQLKVVSKEIIDLKEELPVYDMTVDGAYPNFQLDSGIFAHNCPGGGKSRTMAYLAKHALELNKKVVFITLELTEAETLANVYTSATGIGLSEMLDPRNKQEFIEKLTVFRNTYSDNMIVKFYKPNNVTTDTIHNYIQKVIQVKREKTGVEWKPDVIFIDYLDKLLPTQKLKGNIYEDGGNVATDCKNLAITFEVPVISGSQLGRYTWAIEGNTVVTMDSIAESAQKVHLAHSLTTLNSNAAEKEKSLVRLYLAKSRTGAPGRIVFCENNLGKCRLTEVDEWDPTTLQTTQKYSLKDSTTRK